MVYEADTCRLNSVNDGKMGVRDDILWDGERRALPSPSAPPVVNLDVLYVALGKDSRESEPILMYAVDIAKARKMNICILHVHQTFKKKPKLGTRFIVSPSQEENHYHEQERKELQNILDGYIQICEQAKVEAGKLCLETDSIEKGIVQLISVHGIKWLVMGAATNSLYSKKIKGLKSRKAIHVCREAITFCQIWFVFKGNLVYTRLESSDGVHEYVHHPPVLASSNTDSASSTRSLSIPDGVVCDISEEGTDFGSLSRRSRSTSSSFFTPSSEGAEEASLYSFPKTKGNENHADRAPLHHHSSVESSAFIRAPPLPQEGENDDLYARLEQYMAETESSQIALHEESMKRKKAEKEAIDAMRKAKASETMYNQELQHRKEIENNLQKCSREAEMIKQQLDKVTEELRVAQEQKSSLETKIADYDGNFEEFKGKLFAAVDSLQIGLIKFC